MVEVLHRVKYSFRVWKFVHYGACGGTASPTVNLGTLHISKTIRARKFKFYTHVDRIKCTFRLWNFFW